MDNTTASTQLPMNTKNGIYVRGVVISNRVDAFKRKDGSGLVIKVTHEIALQPGVVIWERYFDPKKDFDVVRLDGDKVTTYPSLPEFQVVTLRAERFKSDGDKFIISSASILGV
jgi:hypothetical protein